MDCVCEARTNACVIASTINHSRNSLTNHKQSKSKRWTGLGTGTDIDICIVLLTCSDVIEFVTTSVLFLVS